MSITVDQLTALQSRIDSINTKKIAAQAELTMLKAQYEEKRQELAGYGITDLSNLAETVANLEKKLENMFAELESQVAAVETRLL